ncbi:DNA ligase 1-like [Clytia hemisphaerica]|uniref:DNA ligase 1-like n=1 Tax=Clytia hemisphaerica TaxID=252671 RepID=UPI0034D50D90
MRERRNKRKEMRMSKNKEPTEIELKKLNNEIEEMINKEQVEKSNKIASEIEEKGGVNSPGFWKVINPPNKGEDSKVAMLSSEGELKVTEKEVREVYKQHYKKLLKTPNAENEEESQQEREVERNFRLLKNASKLAAKSTEKIEKKELRKAKKC